jgi:hypothetical protein
LRSITKITKPLTQLDVTSLPEGVCARFSGAAGFTDITNENGVDISELAWETAMSRPEYLEILDGRKMWSYCEHPATDEPNPLAAIGCVVETSIDKEARTVNATIDIFDTPDGQKIAKLIKYGSKFGISERGRGLFENGGDYGQVIPDSFYLLGFDIVTCPAYPEAIPQAIAASQKGSVLKELTSIASSASPTVLKLMRNIPGLPNSVKEVVSSRLGTPGQSRARAALQKLNSGKKVASTVEVEEDKRILSKSDLSPVNFTVTAEVAFTLVVEEDGGLQLMSLDGDVISAPTADNLINFGVVSLSTVATDPESTHLLPIDLIEDEAAGIIAVNLRKQLKESRNLPQYSGELEVQETVALYGAYDEEVGYWFETKDVRFASINSSMSNRIIASLQARVRSLERQNSRKTAEIKSSREEIQSYKSEIQSSRNELQKLKNITSSTRDKIQQLEDELNKTIRSSKQEVRVLKADYEFKLNQEKKLAQSIRSSKQETASKLSEYQQALVECLVMLTPGSSARDFNVNSSVRDMMATRKRIVASQMRSTPIAVSDRPIRKANDEEDENGIDPGLLALMGGRQ